MPPDERTLTRLHQEHAVSAYRYAWFITKDESLAQELVQDLFLHLARDADSVVYARSERAMILTMVRRKAMDAIRSRNRESNALLHLEDSIALGWFEPANNVLTEEDHQQLTSALASLPEEQRTVIHLHIWEDMNFRQIGEMLDLPTQTIASRYRYALDKLRRHKDTLV